MTAIASPTQSTALMEGLTPDEIREAIEQMDSQGHDIAFNATMDFSMAFASNAGGK